MDPQLGVFLSVDPVTAYDQPVGHFNRYRYANGNPYKFTDPEGRQSLPRSVYEIDWTKPETRQALREAVSMVADFRAVAVSSTATEADAMTTRKIPPFPVDEPTNDDDNPAFDLSTFQGCLKRIRDGEGSDGMLWPEENLSDGRRQSLARIDRAAVGMLTAVEMLHAASRCESTATPDRHLDEGVVEGLFFACRELAELVCREVRPS